MKGLLVFSLVLSVALASPAANPFFNRVEDPNPSVSFVNAPSRFFPAQPDSDLSPFADATRIDNSVEQLPVAIATPDILTVTNNNEKERLPVLIAVDIPRRKDVTKQAMAVDEEKLDVDTSALTTIVPPTDTNANATCPIVFEKAAAECRGQRSSCWSPGGEDIDCDQGVWCCFNGCVNECASQTPMESTTQIEIMEDDMTTQESTEASATTETPASTEFVEEIDVIGVEVEVDTEGPEVATGVPDVPEITDSYEIPDVYKPPSCKIVYVTRYEDKFMEICNPENVCKTDYQQTCTEKCDTIIQTVNTEVAKVQCKDVQKPIQKVIPKTECTTQLVEKCEVKIVEECTGNKYDSYSKYECKQVPKKECRVIPEQKCVEKLETEHSFQTVAECKQVTELVPEQVPRNVCRNHCSEVPKESCVAKPRCRTQTIKMTFLVPKQEC